MNFANLDGVTFAKFCGMTTGELDGAIEMCKNIASGDITVEFSDGEVVKIPICEECYERIRLDKSGSSLLE